MSRNPPLIRAILFDWAGTTVDHGSRAPVEVFLEVFRRAGVEVSAAEVRGPMGRAKRDHIEALLALPRVAEAWYATHGRLPGPADVDRLYADFLPLQGAVLKRHGDVIAGVPEVVAECRSRGIKIGATTGYTRALMEVAAPLARAGGFEPDVIVCADDVPRGRPAPWMIFRAAERLDVYPMSDVVVVDDTPVGIEAGLNAGAWTVAVTRTGQLAWGSPPRKWRDSIAPSWRPDWQPPRKISDEPVRITSSRASPISCLCWTRFSRIGWYDIDRAQRCDTLRSDSHIRVPPPCPITKPRSTGGDKHRIFGMRPTIVTTTGTSTQASQSEPRPRLVIWAA